MADVTQICNMALARIGQQPINDINDDSPVARACLSLYEDTVREVARSHPWNCLKARADLAQNATAPEFGWAYAYTMPTDCVRVIDVNGYDPIYTPAIYEINGRDILTDDDECKMTYIRYNEDPTGFDSLLVRSIVTLLASYLAGRIAQDDARSMTLREEYERTTLRIARKVDANEQKRRRYPWHRDSEWVQARYYNSTVSDV